MASNVASVAPSFSDADLTPTPSTIRRYFMKSSAALTALIVAVALGSGASPANADSNEAHCQIQKDGETKHGPSGPCTFSQRQGYIDLDLRNGDTFSLSPANQPNHFKDQKGNKVVRTQAGGDTQVFKWENGKKVVVTFGGAAASGGGNAAVGSGETPAGLEDLVHSRLVGGEVDDELMRRGYKQARNEVQGDDVYSYWRKSSNGQCVVVRFNASRHVASIASAFESSCK